MELEHWKALGTLEPEPAMAVAVARPWLCPSRGRGRGRAVAVAVAFSQYVLLHPPYLLSTYITVTILGRRCRVKGSLWLCSFNVGSQLQRLFYRQRRFTTCWP